MKFKNKLKNKKPKHLVVDEEIAKLKNNLNSISLDTTKLQKFSDFPLSQNTLKGLKESSYFTPTEIQKATIIPALQGKDIVATAITGSGKTLAFLIPLLEHLFMNKWSRNDGIGAIIISPTRELAYQIFETLKKVGRFHDFSAGLIIGGKNLKFERRRMDQCNILICTPGRLLQHMDENPLFNSTTMEILVLDEADRCLDIGFEKALNAIIENMPPERQTLLFSATQTNSVKDLVRLSLNEPVSIDTKKQNVTGTAISIPELLQQSYVVIPLEEKITMLWSFIRNHLKQKIIIFLASSKQVKYIYEIFCKLRPGVSLLALYGTLHQDRRLAIYEDFMRKKNVVLFATDVASRGLDFPAVNWVVQLDCPEDVTQYIHRAGRSARNNTRGESLLVLMPSEEEAMLEELKSKFIEPRKIHIDPKKLFSPRIKIESYVAQNFELKQSAQRAFISYIKSVFLMKNRRIFNVLKLNFDAYANSLGLVLTPRLPFLERLLRGNQQLKTDPETKTVGDGVELNSLPLQQTKIKTTTNTFKALSSDSETDEEFFKIKRADHEIPSEEFTTMSPLNVVKNEKIITKTALAKKAIKKKIGVNMKIKFDETGEQIRNAQNQLQSELAKEYEKEIFKDEVKQGGIDIATVKKVLVEEDKFDKKRFREIVKQRKLKLKDKARKKAEEIEEDSEDNASSDDDNSVDLSWLPDPNKIYKEDNRVENDDSQISYESNSDDNQDIKPPNAKKMKVMSKLTLSDAEIIASQLLSNM